MCRPQPLGLATGPQLHRHEFRLQLEQPVSRKSLDPVHRTLPSRKPDPSLWKHALPVRFWKYSGEDDWQGISPNGLLCWRVHFVPSATRPWNLPSRYWDAGCLGSHLHTCGMRDADEPADVVKSRLRLTFTYLDHVCDFFQIDRKKGPMGLDVPHLYVRALEGDNKAAASIREHCLDDLRATRQAFLKLKPLVEQQLEYAEGQA